MDNPIKMDDLGVPLFLETPIWGDVLKESQLPSIFCLHRKDFDVKGREQT